MTDNPSTLESVLFAHQRSEHWNAKHDGWVECSCTTDPEFAVPWSAAHQAEMVAAAGLVVVALPEPTGEVRHAKQRNWKWSTPVLDMWALTGLGGAEEGVLIGGLGPRTPDDARAVAAAILAAAAAAERSADTEEQQ